MNKREAKLRAMKLSLYCMKEAFANNGVFDLVDEDTSNEEALQIADEAKAFRDSLRKRIVRLEERLTKRVPDALRAYDMGEVNGVKLTYVNGNVFATPAKQVTQTVRREVL